MLFLVFQEYLIMQNFKQKLQQKLFPHKIQLMKLIELPCIAFEKRISQEIEENPLLEIDKNNEAIEDNDKIHEYNTDLNVNKRKRSNNISPKKNNNFYEYLRYQLSNFILTDEEFIIADYILGSIDEEGYFRREFIEFANAISFVYDQRVDKHKIEKLVEIVQKLYPIGLGARNLRECLLIQLEHKPISPTILTAKLIINNNFDLLYQKQYSTIRNIMKLNHQVLHSAINEIKSLNPKPGKISEVNTFDTIQRVPDFFLSKEEDLLELYLNRRNTRRLYISPYYIEMLRRFKDFYLPNNKKIVFIKKKLEKAKWLLAAIKQRKKTLLFTMKAILIFQKAFFLSGEKKNILPMTLKNIAEIIRQEISTVSRVVNRKYIETPYGTFLLKNFFSEKIFHSYGKETSNIEVKYLISNIFDKEDSKLPFTDEKISLIFKKIGYNVARRTITKYRDQLHIPIARLRKK